jgi:hypothetical protein
MRRCSRTLSIRIFWNSTDAVHEALKALNRLASDGILRDYAIGGAIGASFYLPAMQTEDIDVFVFLPPASTPLLVSLTPVYDALKTLGGTVEREYVKFGEWPIQILTDATPLIAEAIREAVQVDFDGIPTKVMRAEYLCAIALQTGRTKDFARIRLFLEHGELDSEIFTALAVRHGLSDRLSRVLNQNAFRSDEPQ